MGSERRKYFEFLGGDDWMWTWHSAHEINLVSLKTTVLHGKPTPNRIFLNMIMSEKYPSTHASIRIPGNVSEIVFSLLPQYLVHSDGHVKNCQKRTAGRGRQRLAGLTLHGIKSIAGSVQEPSFDNVRIKIPRERFEILNKLISAEIFSEEDVVLPGHAPFMRIGFYCDKISKIALPINVNCANVSNEETSRKEAFEMEVRKLKEKTERCIRELCEFAEHFVQDERAQKLFESEEKRRKIADNSKTETYSSGDKYVPKKSFS